MPKAYESCVKSLLWLSFSPTRKHRNQFQIPPNQDFRDTILHQMRRFFVFGEWPIESPIMVDGYADDMEWKEEYGPHPWKEYWEDQLSITAEEEVLEDLRHLFKAGMHGN
jgi:hypothetical protein